MTRPFKGMAAHKPMCFQRIKGTDTACQPHRSRKQLDSLQADIYTKIVFLGKDSLFGKDDGIFSTHPVICQSRTGWGENPNLSLGSKSVINLSQAREIELGHDCFKDRVCRAFSLQIVIDFPPIDIKVFKKFYIGSVYHPPKWILAMIQKVKYLGWFEH